MLFELRPEEVIVVEDQAEPSKDDDVRLCLKADAREERVVGFSCHRKDGNLLALYQAVEEVDHRYAGLDDARREDPALRVDCDAHLGRHLGLKGEIGAAIDGQPRAVEHASE